MVGDQTVITQYLKIVANGGGLVPTPLLEVAADLYDDDDHVAAIRAYYNANFEVAATHLQITPPGGGFFLWLKVDDDVDFVQRLMAEQAVRALPGSFMATAADAGNPSTGNPGTGYVRLALVHDLASTDKAMRRIAEIYGAQ
jgi:N-succinyldiaminopimelate aminotransferase